MSRPSRPRGVSPLVVASLILPILSTASFSTATNPPADAPSDAVRRIVVPNAEADRVVRRVPSARLIQRGDETSVIAAPVGAFRSRSGLVSDLYRISPEFDEIRLGSGVVDTTAGATTMRSSQTAAAPLRIVQFAAPVLASDLDELRRRGVSTLSRVPHNAVLIWDRDDVLPVGGGAATLPNNEIHAVVAFDPAMKIPTSILGQPAPQQGFAISIIVYNQDTDAFSADIAELCRILGTGDAESLVRSNLGRDHFALSVTGAPLDMVLRVASLDTVVRIDRIGTPQASSEDVFMTLANQVKIVGGKEVPKGPLTDAPTDNQLDFLESRLSHAGTGVYQNPDNYPLVILLDSGIDNGGSTTDDSINPSAPDFHEFGRLDQPSRVVSASHFRVLKHFPDPMNPWIPGNPSTYPTLDFDHDGGLDFYTDAITLPSILHGHAIASSIMGFGAIPDPLPPGWQLSYFVDVNSPNGIDTGLRFGMGTNPFGRLQSVKFIEGIVNVTSPPFAGNLTPEDYFWAVQLAVNRAKEINAVASAHPTLISNNAFVIRGAFTPDAVQPASKVGVANPDYFAYTVDSLTFDATDDLYYPESGRDPLLFVIAAGNEGGNFTNWNRYTEAPAPADPGDVYTELNTVQSPGFAKNALTIGGSETSDIRGTQYCSTTPSPYMVAINEGRADNGQDAWRYGSKGRQTYGLPQLVRIKPDLVAPAESGYVNLWDLRAGGACDPAGLANDEVIQNFDPTVAPFQRYWRIGGTSLSTGSMSGIAQICGFQLSERWGIPNPRPALLKAYMVNAARMIRGEFTGPEVAGAYIPEKVPSPYQGFGRINLDAALDSTPRLIVNEETALCEGEWITYWMKVSDPTKPVRVTLAWTDPVSPYEIGELYFDLVNDLNLSVRYNLVGKYFGNTFDPVTKDKSFQYPLLWPVLLRDQANNVEAVVFDPVPGRQFFEVTVAARSLAMDGISNSTTVTPHRQPFALVVYNAERRW